LLRQLWAALLLVVADGWGSLSTQQGADISLFPSSSTPECSKTNFLAMDFTIWDTAPYGRLFNQLIQFRNAWYLAHMMGRTFVVPDMQSGAKWCKRSQGGECCGEEDMQQEEPPKITDLFGAYVNMTSLMSDPYFCAIPQSQLDYGAGISVKAVNVNEIFFWQPTCSFVERLDARTLLSPNDAVAAAVDQFLAESFGGNGKNFTAVHFRGKMFETMCDTQPVNLRTVRALQARLFGGDQPIFLMTDGVCPGVIAEFRAAGAVSIDLRSPSVAAVLKAERRKVALLAGEEKDENDGAVGAVYLDLLVATRAALFVPTPSSTVSTLAQRLRASLQKPCLHEGVLLLTEGRAADPGEPAAFAATLAKWSSGRINGVSHCSSSVGQNDYLGRCSEAAVPCPAGLEGRQELSFEQLPCSCPDMLMNYGVQSVLNLQKHPDVLAMNRRESKGGAFLSSVRKIRTVQAAAGGGGGGRQPMLVDTSCFLETRTVLLYEPTDTAAMASQCPVAWRLQGGGEGWSTLRWTVAQQAGGDSAAWLFMNATLALTRWTGVEPELKARCFSRKGIWEDEQEVPLGEQLAATLKPDLDGGFMKWAVLTWQGPHGNTEQHCLGTEEDFRTVVMYS
jgi:hypothetical protein